MWLEKDDRMEADPGFEDPKVYTLVRNIWEENNVQMFIFLILQNVLFCGHIGKIPSIALEGAVWGGTH